MEVLKTTRGRHVTSPESTNWKRYRRYDIKDLRGAYSNAIPEGWYLHADPEFKPNKWNHTVETLGTSTVTHVVLDVDKYPDLLVVAKMINLLFGIRALKYDS